MGKQNDMTEEQFKYDSVAGPVYAFRPAGGTEATELAAAGDRPQIVQALVWPYPESRDRRPELRSYYALNLALAVARAAEIVTRLREQDRTAVLAVLRPATAAETEDFFRATDILEAGMAAPVSAADVRMKDPAGAARIPGQRENGINDQE